MEHVCFFFHLKVYIYIIIIIKWRKLSELYWLTSAYSAFRNFFSQTLFDFKKSISGPIELKFSGKTLYAIL